MSVWLAVLLITIVVAAVAGMVPLRRYSDREWALYQELHSDWRVTEDFMVAAFIGAKAIQDLGRALGDVGVAAGRFATAFNREVR